MITTMSVSTESEHKAFVAEYKKELYLLWKL